MTKAKTSPKSEVRSPKLPERRLSGRATFPAFVLVSLTLGFLSGLPVAAQTPVSNLVFTVGTTIQDSGGTRKAIDQGLERLKAMLPEVENFVQFIEASARGVLV